MLIRSLTRDHCACLRWPTLSENGGCPVSNNLVSNATMRPQDAGRRATWESARLSPHGDGRDVDRDHCGFSRWRLLAGSVKWPGSNALGSNATMRLQRGSAGDVEIRPNGNGWGVDTAVFNGLTMVRYGPGWRTHACSRPAMDRFNDRKGESVEPDK